MSWRKHRSICETSSRKLLDNLQRLELEVVPIHLVFDLPFCVAKGGRRGRMSRVPKLDCLARRRRVSDFDLERTGELES